MMNWFIIIFIVNIQNQANGIIDCSILVHGRSYLFLFLVLCVLPNCPTNWFKSDLSAGLRALKIS